MEEIDILQHQNDANTATLTALLIHLEAAERQLRDSEATHEEARNTLMTLVRRRQEIEARLEAQKNAVSTTPFWSFLSQPSVQTSE